MLLTVFQPTKSFKLKHKSPEPRPAWQHWAAVVALLVAYPLSFGPVLLLICFGILPDDCLLLYLPLILLGQVLYPVLGLMYWSVHVTVRLVFTVWL